MNYAPSSVWLLCIGLLQILEEQLRKLLSATLCPRRAACANVSVSFSHSASRILINSVIKLDLSRIPCYLLQWQRWRREILVQPKRKFNQTRGRSGFLSVPEGLRMAPSLPCTFAHTLRTASGVAEFHMALHAMQFFGPSSFCPPNQFFPLSLGKT